MTSGSDLFDIVKRGLLQRYIDLGNATSDFIDQLGPTLRGQDGLDVETATAVELVWDATRTVLPLDPNILGQMLSALGGSQTPPQAGALGAGLRTPGVITMPTLVIPGCFQVTVQMVSGGVAVENVFGMYYAAGTSAGAASVMQEAWEAPDGPLSRLSSLVHMVGYRAVDIGTPDGSITELASSTAGGVVASNSLSTNAASCLISYNGDSRSRSTRGRTYLGPLMEADINADGRTLEPGRITLFETAANTMLSTASAAAYPLVVLSRKNSTYTLITAATVESVIATQRRRIRGRSLS